MFSRMSVIINSRALTLINKFIFLTFLLLSLFVQDCFSQEVLATTRFGKISYFKTKEQPRLVVFYLAGNNVSENIPLEISELQKKSILLVKIDVASYLKELNKDNEDCIYLAGEFERLSQVIQKMAKLDEVSKPLLIGDGVGSALVYTILAQSSKSFLGGVSYNFCPELPFTKKLCPDSEPKSSLTKKRKSINLEMTKSINIPWYFNLALKNTCQNKSALGFPQALAENYQAKREVFSCTEHSCELFDKFIKLSEEQKPQSPVIQTEKISELPLIELPSENAIKDYFIILLSGDGGWATIDKALGDYFQENQINVVGFDALKYFWKEKNAETLAQDLENIILNYQKKWGSEKVLLIGYSLGAEVLPFALNKMENKIKSKVLSTILLNPGLTAEFEIHFTDWLDIETPEDEQEILPEISKLNRQSIICLYGSDEEEDSLCSKLKNSDIIVKELGGSHHFDGDYETLAQTILKLLPSKK